MRRTTGIFLVLLTLTGTAGAGDLDLSDVRRLAVQHGGRVKPLDTFAREQVYGIFESRSVDGLDPVGVILSVLADPGPWLAREFLPVTDDRIAKQVFGGRDVVSPAEVVVHEPGLERLWGNGDHARRLLKAFGPDLTPSERSELLTRIELGDAARPLVSRTRALRLLDRALRIVPTPSAAMTWQSLAEAEQAGRAEALRGAFTELLVAFREEDAPAFRTAATAALEAQREIRPTAMPPDPVVTLEILYNGFPRGLVLAIFALATALHVLFTVSGARIAERLALAGVVAGILVGTYLVTMFTIFAERLPLGNVDEVFLVAVWFVPVIGLFLRWLLRNAVYGLVGAALATLGYVAWLVMTPEGIPARPLMAVLYSSWREIHILSIILSYAVLFVAFGIHVAYAVIRSVEGWSRSAGEAARSLDRQAYHVVAWGFLLLGTGIATGAAWGHEAWGRYWGWDPKEVCALVAWVVYALFLHLRVFRRWRGIRLAAVNLAGFAGILFTYFGVTYWYSGLHSYGA